MADAFPFAATWELKDDVSFHRRDWRPAFSPLPSMTALGWRRGRSTPRQKSRARGEVGACRSPGTGARAAPRMVAPARMAAPARRRRGWQRHPRLAPRIAAPAVRRCPARARRPHAQRRGIDGRHAAPSGYVHPSEHGRHDGAGVRSPRLQQLQSRSRLSRSERRELRTLQRAERQNARQHRPAAARMRRRSSRIACSNCNRSAA